jgi:hypothetical protein
VVRGLADGEVGADAPPPYIVAAVLLAVVVLTLLGVREVFSPTQLRGRPSITR